MFHDGSTVVQVWHQLSTRECYHGIISNQHTFLLVHRSGNNLHISPSYQYQPDDNNALAATLSDLSFFIAHSLASRPGNTGTAQSPGPFTTALGMPLDNPDTHSCNLPQPVTPATPGVSGGSIMVVSIPTTSCSCVYLRFLTPEQPGIAHFELGDIMVEHMLTTSDVQTWKGHYKIRGLAIQYGIPPTYLHHIWVFIRPHCIIWCGPVQSTLPLFYPSGPGQADLGQPADSLWRAHG